MNGIGGTSQYPIFRNLHILKSDLTELYIQVLNVFFIQFFSYELPKKINLLLASILLLVFLGCRRLAIAKFSKKILGVGEGFLIKPLRPSRRFAWIAISERALGDWLFPTK